MEKEKTILILGNGFDIAHGLPTQYTDFLDFLDDKTYHSSKAYSVLSTSTDGLGQDYCDKARDVIVCIVGTDNNLLDFINSQLELHRLSGEDGVDFEQEIGIIIRYVEKRLAEKKAVEPDIFASLKFDFDMSGVPSDPKELHESFIG